MLLRTHGRGNIVAVTEFAMLGSIEPNVKVFMIEVGGEIAFVGEKNAKVEMHKFAERIQGFCERGLIARRQMCLGKYWDETLAREQWRMRTPRQTYC